VAAPLIFEVAVASTGRPLHPHHLRYLLVVWEPVVGQTVLLVLTLVVEEVVYVQGRRVVTLQQMLMEFRCN
jgi:tetrahydromethanopterin S-methyltransferase subunit D